MWIGILFVYCFIQAATEFLPVSSSSHLVVLHEILPLRGIDPMRFDIALHWGTLLAVVVVFRRDLVRIIQAVLASIVGRPHDRDQRRLGWFLVAATIVPAVVGAFVADSIEQRLRTPFVVAIALALGGILLYFVDRIRDRSKTLQSMTVWEALLVGASQVVAFIPGVSRSGITIITARAIKMNRPDAVRFSFLLSIPVVFAAGVHELPSLAEATGVRELGMMGIAMVTSGIFGYLVIRWLLAFVARRSFSVFAWYRIALAVAISMLLLR